MIRILNRKEINDQLWNDCVEQSPDGQAFFYTWYLDACCPLWSALGEDNYAAVFPFAHRSKFGIDYIYQPFFTRHFGLIAKSKTDFYKQAAFLSAIPSPYKYLDFCLHTAHQQVPEGIIPEHKIYQQLSLRTDYSQIQKGYNENLVRNLKKASKSGYTLKHNFQPEAVVDLFYTHQKALREEFKEADYSTLKNLMISAAKNTTTYCWAVQDPSGEIHAGAFFIKTKTQLLYLKGFSSEKGKKQGAMHFLFDQLIQYHAGQDITLDFGGSSVKSVARFYYSFGSVDCLYLRLKIKRLPAALRWIKS